MCNFDEERVEKLLSALQRWSDGNASIKGLALVGSWGDEDRQHAEADADLILIVDEPDAFRSRSDWMEEIDWKLAGLGPGHWSECDYGGVCSRHLKFADGAEIEVSFVGEDWASIAPIHPATRRMAGNGMRVVHDPDGLLGRLLTAL
ncbi:MAG: hypothetical protein R3D44_05425 [Hyphomicrobiaceae bacterium]